jgi:hypothetical protein
MLRDFPNVSDEPVAARLLEAKGLRDAGLMLFELRRLGWAAITGPGF